MKWGPIKWGFVSKLAIGALALFAVQRFCRRETDGFCLENIRSNLLPSSKWEVAPPLSCEEVRSALNQSYSYLARGVQCYAFVSADGKYVLKFLRHSHLRPPFWLTHLPLPPFLLPYKEKKEAQFRARLYKDLKSYQIAYESLPEETGLLYLHLNKGPSLSRSITIIDRLRIAHLLSLEGTEFLLQRRASLLYPAIDELMRMGKEEEAKQALGSLVDLLLKRFQLGIFDKDPDLNRNFGLLEGRALQIDVGRFRHSKEQCLPEVYKPALLRITDNLHQWLEERYPQLGEHLMQKVSSVP